MKNKSFWKSFGADFAVVTVLAAAVVFFLPFGGFDSSSLPSADDDSVRAWLDATLFDQTMRSALERYGALPGQNIYLNGGIPLGAHPLDGALSPLSLALHDLDALTAVKIKTFLAVFAGAAALFLLAGRAGAGRLASATAALIVPASGFVQQRIITAPLDLQVLFAAYALVVVLYGSCVTSYCITAAVLFAIAAMQSGSLIFFAPVALVLAALIRIYSDVEEKKDAAASLGLILMFGLLFATIKWLPAVELLKLRFMESAAKSFLVHPNVGLITRAGRGISLLTPAFAGWLIIPLLLAAAAGSRIEGRRGKLSALSLIFLFITILPHASLDVNGKASAWMAIRSLSMPQSVAPVFALMTLGALCALAFHKILEWKKPAGYALTAVFAALLAFGHFSRDIPDGGQMPQSPDLSQYQNAPDREPDFFPVQLYDSRKHKALTSHHPALFVARQAGVVNGLQFYGPKTRVSPKIKIRSGADRTWKNKRYKGEVYFGHNRGKVLDYQDRGNLMKVSVKAYKKDSDLIFNRNFDSGWSAEGYETGPLKGLLGVHLPEPGDYDITLVHRPTTALYGAFLSGAAVFFVMLFSAVGWIAHKRKMKVCK